ncbi:uncharacterized protein METZ01_LOCUS324611 [marine metagenome]|uniref:Uncharacterized protein n=1 Tax=marine metagenome TaxID=408172 RepID=A0A382PFX1_9ZZZZ
MGFSEKKHWNLLIHKDLIKNDLYSNIIMM